MNLLTIFLCVGFFVTAHSFMFMDDCTLYPKWPDAHNASHTVEMTVKSSCRNGTIDWNYPKGNVLIHFPFGGTFSVCIVDGLGGSVLTAIDESGRCYKPLSTISDTPICVDAVSGKMDIMFQAPDIMYYMAAVNYYVDSHQGIRC